MVKQTQHSTIKINGKLYNAHTGHLIEIGPKPGLQDVIRKRPSTSHDTKPSHTVHKSAQKSHTLMRKAVKRPSLGKVTANQAMTGVMKGQAAVMTSVDSFFRVNRSRIRHAENVKKNALISRFSDISPSAKHASNVPKTFEAAHTPIYQAPVANSEKVMRAINGKSVSHHKVIEEGLKKATSHTEKPVKKPKLHHRIAKKVSMKKRTTKLATATLSVLLLGSFFAYQNMAKINVKYASAKSGVNASLPGYQPSGFAVSKKIEYGSGAVTISYRANADERSYAITQRSSDWDSQALKEHLASLDGMTPQSYPDNGLMIFLHGESSADWVAGGVWYSITGNAKLNTEQLINIASSI